MGAPRDPLEAVAVWHAAVNAGDADAAAALTTEDVEVAGPRGSEYGRDAVRDWVRRSGIRLEPVRAYAGGPEVVVEAAASWPEAGPGKPRSGEWRPGASAGASPGGAPMVIATSFIVTDGGIARIARHDDLPAALADAALDAGDEVALPR